MAGGGRRRQEALGPAGVPGLRGLGTLKVSWLWSSVGSRRGHPGLQGESKARQTLPEHRRQDEQGGSGRRAQGRAGTGG